MLADGSEVAGAVRMGKTSLLSQCHQLGRRGEGVWDGIVVDGLLPGSARGSGSEGEVADGQAGEITEFAVL